MRLLGYAANAVDKQHSQQAPENAVNPHTYNGSPPKVMTYAISLYAQANMLQAGAPGNEQKRQREDEMEEGRGRGNEKNQNNQENEKNEENDEQQ